MTVESLLSQLDGVRARGAGKWTARCPAHDDRSPSLSVREGDRGLLLKCWAGCELAAITSALGLSAKDLFYDVGADPAEIRKAQRRRAQDRRRREAQQHAQGLEIDTLREAERLIRSAHSIDISAWTDAQLDRVMGRLGDAYDALWMERMTHVY